MYDRNINILLRKNTKVYTTFAQQPLSLSINVWKDIPNTKLNQYIFFFKVSICQFIIFLVLESLCVEKTRFSFILYTSRYNRSVQILVPSTYSQILPKNKVTISRPSPPY